MSVPTTRHKQACRLRQKSLCQQLCQAFEHEYGFEKGRRVIPVIVEDILDKVRDYYGPDRAQGPDQIVYTAAHAKARPARGKTMARTRQQAIRLTIIAPEDCDAYAEGAPVLARQRLVRWLHEAKAQGALLTTADLALISGMSCGTVERHVRRHEAETGTLLPLRGTVHDSSSKLTHKAKIVELYLAGQLPPEIARATDHSLEAVERYLRDFDLVREFAPRYDAEAIGRLMQRGVRVVNEYLELLAANQPPAQQADQRNRGHPAPSTVGVPQSGSHEPATDKSRTEPLMEAVQPYPDTPGPESRAVPQRGAGEAA